MEKCFEVAQVNKNDVNNNNNNNNANNTSRAKRETAADDPLSCLAHPV